MNTRFGFVTALAIGCLTVFPALTGCSGSKSNDGGTDGSTATDAGTDAGTADAGTPISQHGLGMKCSSPSNMQANCDRNLVCVGVSPLNMCTKLGCDPSSLTSCGTTEDGLQNICVGNSTSNSFCLRGCDPTKPTPCQRPDFACLSFQDNQGGTINFCAPDCRTMGNDCYVNIFGGYGMTCNQMTGQCEQGADCSTASCASGQVCYTDSSVTPASKTCVADCRVAGNSCPGSRTCDMGTGLCKAAAPGSVCQNPQDCDNNSLCITFAQGAAAGECLSLCSKDSDCAASSNGGLCDLGLTNGQNVCEPPNCTVPDAGMPADAGTDGGMPFMCGTGESCQPLQLPTDGGTRTFGGCVPN